MRPDPLEGRDAPKDLRYIIATLLGFFLMIAGGYVLWNVIGGGTFSGNVGRDMSYIERVIVSVGLIASGATLLRYAIRGATRLSGQDSVSD